MTHNIKKIVLVSGAIFTVIVILGLYRFWQAYPGISYSAKNHARYQENRQATYPDSYYESVRKRMVEKADRYIIDTVGVNYFKENYTVRLEKSLVPSRSAPMQLYDAFIVYEYLPATRLTGKEQFVRVDYPIEHPAYKTSGYVACIKNGKVCEPTITEREAIRLATSFAGYTESEVIGMSGIFVTPTPHNFTEKEKNFFWLVSEPSSGGNCSISKTFYVDATNGSVKLGGGSGSCI